MEQHQDKPGGWWNLIWTPVFFVYGNDYLLIGRVGYLNRFSLWLSKGTQPLLPSDKPHFRPLPLSSFYLEERKWKDAI